MTSLIECAGNVAADFSAELALGAAGALLGERFMLIVPPTFGFSHPECTFPAPAGVGPKETLHCDLQLLNWYPKVPIERCQ